MVIFVVKEFSMILNRDQRSKVPLLIAATPETETTVDCIYGDCPLHAENPLFNAVTLAAFEEAKAIMRGEIPAKRYNSLEEAWKDSGL
jgi:hypothetical protein